VKRLTMGFLVMLVLSGALSNSAHAVWHNATINRIQFRADNTMHVYINGGNHECGSDWLVYMYPTAVGAKTTYAALLVWQAQRKAVQFFVASCTGIAANFEMVESAVDTF